MQPQNTTQTEQNTTRAVTVPRNIQAANHRRAYAAAWRRGYTGKLLDCIPPMLRNSLVRGFMDGRKARDVQDVADETNERAAAARAAMSEAAAVEAGAIV